MGNKAITAAVVSHRQASLVASLVQDLIRLRPPDMGRLLIVANVAEPDLVALERLAQAAPFAVQFLHNEVPHGFGANHNRAFAHCDTPWFAVLNPDLRLDSDPFAPLLAAARAGDVLLAPRVLESDGRVADAARRVLTPWQLVRRTLRYRAPAAADFDWLAGMFLLLRSDAFRAVGGFDERYFMYSEDADLCLRLQLAGGRIRQVGEVQVLHAAQRASRRSWQHFRWHVTSLLRYWTSATYWRYLAARRAIRAERSC